MKNSGIYSINFNRQKKANYLINFQKFRGQPNKKKAKFVIFGLEKANLATLQSGALPVFFNFFTN